MTAAAIPLPKNSTTVRSPVAFRTALKAAALLSSPLADELALHLFCLPRRAKNLRAPTLAGHEAKAFHVNTAVGRVAAWSWGEGPMVLLAHGWEGHAGQMMPFVAPLLAEGYRVVVFDQPAHGRSEGRFAHVLKFERAIRDVANALSPNEPLHGLIGHSLGGAGSVLAIHRGLKTKHVVLLCPVAEPRPFARMMSTFFELSPERADGLIEAIQKMVGGDIGAIDGRFLARTMDVPALVFHDPADREVPFEHGRGIASEWPHAQFVELQGLGHRRLLKDSAVIERAVQFIRTPVSNLSLLKGA